MNLLLTSSTDNQNLRRRLLLLLGQSFTLGILLALLVIVANALFLTDYGSKFLPYVYLLVAVLGSLVAYGSAQAQRVWSLPNVAITTMAVTLIFFVLAWSIRITTQARWVSFALITAFPLLLQIGFVLLGGQAGRLLDVRQIRQLFPKIVTGFVVGFIIGGLLMPFLINLLGKIEHVIPVMALACLVILIFMSKVGSQFSAAFQLTNSPTQRQGSKSLPQLLNKKFVRWLFLYQMLLAMLVQLTDFLVLALAETRYVSGEAIAQFFSSFSVILNVTDLFFLLVLAAFLLRRFGLRGGLLANPLFLLLNFAAMMVIAVTVGVGSSSFFVLVVIARVMTITLADGATRTSINAVYQALPAQERTLVQTGAEGIGAPLALGIVGLVLLIFNAISELTIVHIAFFTFLLVLLWIGMSLLVYREYAAALLQTIKRRTLGEVTLALTDEAGLNVVNKLVQSNLVHEVQLALDLLETAVHPSLSSYLLQLTNHEQPEIQIEALRRIEQHQLMAAVPLVKELVDHSEDTAVQGTALRTLCALDEVDAVKRVAAHLNHTVPAIKQGALVGLLRYGGITGIMAAAPHLTAAQQSPSAAERVLAARVIGDIQGKNFYEPLMTLLQDEENEVRQAALMAAAQVRHLRLLPLIINNLSNSATRSAALSTLLAYREAVLPTIAAALNGRTEYSPSDIKRLVRLCGQIGDGEAVALLQQHLSHPQSDIQEQVFIALNHCGFRAQPSDRDTIQKILRQQADYAVNLLAAQRDIGSEDALESLNRALHDEQNRARRRLFYLLSFLYDNRAILRVEEQLSRRQDAEQALAMELLDVTLSAEEKAFVIPLTDPQLEPGQRLHQLAPIIDVPTQNLAAWLEAIISNRSGMFDQPWLQACAVYAVGKLGLDACRGVVEEVLPTEDPIVRETAVWSLQRFASKSV